MHFGSFNASITLRDRKFCSVNREIQYNGLCPTYMRMEEECLRTVRANYIITVRKL